MNAHQMERAAYMAAHRILTTDLTAPELACPGARRSAVVDNMARIIKSVYEAHNERFDETTDWWPSETETSRRREPVGPRASIALVKTS
jgi:hypothetical protein